MSAEHAYDELAVGWALHALEPEDDARFARHLPTCARCARTVAETSEVMAAMARDLPAAEPPPALRERLRAAVAETEQLPPRTPAPRRVGPPDEAPEPAASRWARRPGVLVAAAAAAVVGMGLWVAAVDGARDDLRSTVAAQEQAVAELLRPGRATIAPLTAGERQVATVVVREAAVQVVTDGLAPNDTSSSTYVLWGLGAGDPVALGAFDVARSQIAVQTVGSGETGLDGFPEYGISIEPGRQAPSAPTEVVATGQVAS